MLLLCSKIYLKPHIPLRVGTRTFSFLLVQDIISHITMHIQYWICFSVSISLFIYVSFFLSCNFSRYITGIWFAHSTATHNLPNLFCPNYGLQLDHTSHLVPAELSGKSAASHCNQSHTDKSKSCFFFKPLFLFS